MRSEMEQEKKTYQSTDRVTVLGLVCAKMTKRVMKSRQEDEGRRMGQDETNVASIVPSESGEEEDKEDDEGDERDICRSHT